MHVKARSEKHKNYPERFYVPDEKTGWGKNYPNYSPTYYVDTEVLNNDNTIKKNGWADPEDITLINDLDLRKSYAGEIYFDKEGFPLNPEGRTGLKGRGILGKWGPNFAADPIVTRINSKTGDLEMLAIQRKDNGQWAIPGGMVEEGDTITKTLSKEFEEEAGIKLDMSDATQVYKGYVDDPRNTDNAWMETTAMHKHLAPEIANKMQPVAGDDAKHATWLPITNKTLASFYANHGELIKRAIALMK